MSNERKYKVVRVCGRVHHDFMNRLSYKEAMEVCSYYDWVLTSDDTGGAEWDLYIDHDNHDGNAIDWLE